jgi:2-polyprenyl-3-methyl-5-hydroxy-6-metoxy-1,4-benzoquinol methylase
MPADDLQRFQNLSFEKFRAAALNPELSRYEKIGFPDAYREGKEQKIFADFQAKIPSLLERKRTVLDIGPGCSDLPRMLIQLCGDRQHHLILIDSAEMLAHLPSDSFVEKIAGAFPACGDIEKLRGKIDILICYSVLHYVFAEANIWSFLDAALALLAPGGTMLLGDIPNVSKRKRFFASDAGKAYHRKFTGKDEDPLVQFNQLEPNQIDDAVIFALLSRARAQGFDAYVSPQPDVLPMANRREDILISRP